MRVSPVFATMALCLLVGCQLPVSETPGSMAVSAQNRATAGATQVTVNAAEVYQTLEGWGTSLAWWANVLGDWNDAAEDEVADLLFGSQGLGLNIVRYNVGAGKDPTKTYNTSRTGAWLPAFKSSSTASYDWTQDAAQRDILAKAKAKGANIFEAFANSPPWWMTKSGYTAGNTDGSNNLKDDSYPAFADYLSEVTKHFRDSWGITFRTVTPLNEPSASWWTSGNNQEGSHFDSANQIQIIKELGASLAAKVLTGTTVSAPEEYSVDQSLATYNTYDASAKSYLSQINTHQYSGTNYHGLRDAAWNNGVNPKTLWVSELGVGPGSYNQNDIYSALALGNSIRDGIQELGANGWVYWQAVEDMSGDNNYGLIKANYTGSHSYWVSKQYYGMKNYSNLLRPGSKNIGYVGPNAASGIKGSGYLDANGKVVIVLVNNSSSSVLVDLNVSGKSVTAFTPYVTSTTENFAQLSPVSAAGYVVPALSVVTLVESSAIVISPVSPTLWYKILNRKSTKVLDVTGASTVDGAAIVQWTDNAGLNQQWQFTDVGAGWYKIKNRNSSRLMDISQASTASGAANIQWSDTGGLNQQWQLIDAGAGWYKVQNRNSSLLLDISGASTANGAADIQWPENGGLNQQWQFVAVP